MSLTITLETQIDKFEQVERALAEQALRAGLSAAGNLTEGYIKLNIREQELIDTGNLINSVQTGEPKISGLSGEITVGTNAEYARIHEFGGTIVPRTAKALAIPLTKAARGVAPREFAGKLHIQWRTGAESGALVDESGTAQYALVRQATIPARPYMRPAVDEHKREIGDVFGANVRRVIEGAAR